MIKKYQRMLVVFNVTKQIVDTNLKLQIFKIFFIKKLKVRQLEIVLIVNKNVKFLNLFKIHVNI